MNRGFTLFEVVVTIGVAVTISSLVVADFPKFSRRLELSRAAQAVALSFREAEAAALAVREFGSGIFPAYGLHFDRATAQRYVFFADLKPAGGVVGNFIYDSGELVDTLSLSGTPFIAGLCVGLKSGGVGTGCGKDMLDVVFVRPNPDVYITSDFNTFSDAEIQIRLPTGECKQVTIWQTGQLSIEPSCD